MKTIEIKETTVMGKPEIHIILEGRGVYARIFPDGSYSTYGECDDKKEDTPKAAIIAVLNRLNIDFLGASQKGTKKMETLQTVTLYKVTTTKAYMMSELGSGYSLKPWGNDTTYYEGYDDGGRQYVLPDDYYLGETKYGEPMIYRRDDENYIIITTVNGRPALIDTRMGERPIMLKNAQ